MFIMKLLLFPACRSSQRVSTLESAFPLVKGWPISFSGALRKLFYHTEMQENANWPPTCGRIYLRPYNHVFFNFRVPVIPCPAQRFSPSMLPFWAASDCTIPASSRHDPFSPASIAEAQISSHWTRRTFTLRTMRL